MEALFGNPRQNLRAPVMKKTRVGQPVESANGGWFNKLLWSFSSNFILVYVPTVMSTFRGLLMTRAHFLDFTIVFRGAAPRLHLLPLPAAVVASVSSIFQRHCHLRMFSNEKCI